MTAAATRSRTEDASPSSSESSTPSSRTKDQHHQHHQQQQNNDNHTNQIPYYAQDPAFTSTDVAFLEQHGVVVVEHPAGFEMLEEEEDETSNAVSATEGVAEVREADEQNSNAGCDDRSPTTVCSTPSHHPSETRLPPTPNQITRNTTTTTFLYAPHFPLMLARRQILSSKCPLIVCNDVEEAMGDR